MLLKNVKLFAAGNDLSADANQVDLKYGVASLDRTVFADDADGAGTRIFAAGLPHATVDYKGFFSTVPDGFSNTAVGVEDAPLSVGPTGLDGEPMYFMKAVRTALERGASVGQLFGINGHFEGRGSPLLQGTCMLRGLVGAGVNDRFLASVNMKATAYTMTATTLPTGYSARRVTLTHTAAGAADTLGNASLVGTDELGAAQVETVALVSGGVATSLKAFKTLTSVTTASWVINAGNDTIKVGFADVGVPRQVGEVVTGKYLYAVLHVIDDPAGTSPTLDVVVKSGATAAAAGTTTRITFAQLTARGGIYATRLAGPFGVNPTHPWWQVEPTVGGTASPSFKVSCSIAVQ